MEWSKLKPREKLMVAAIGAVVLAVLYMRMVYAPVQQKISTYQSQIKKAQKQLNELTAKPPQVVLVSGNVSQLEDETARLATEMSTIEKDMPSKFQLSQLVGELTRLSSEVKLDSVKQKIIKDQSFSRVFMEIKFYSNFTDTIKYMAAIESISPFIRVDEMEILEPKGKSVELGGAPIRLLVSCLLAETTDGAVLKAKQEQVDMTEKFRDVMASSARPAIELEESKFVLEGITFDLRNPTAIINGDVYQQNSEISGYKVKKILSDSVILSDGVRDHLLSLKAVAETTK
jgi:Tfp pilus assembly protein PilO